MLAASITPTGPERTGYADAPGGRIWWRMDGVRHLRSQRVPLIGIHGGPGGSHDYLLPLTRLSEERTIILYDQLDCGDSDKPGDARNWTVERFVAEVDALRTALEIDRCIILGHSWGGLIAVEYAARNPAGLQGAILASPLISAARWIADNLAHRAALPPDVQIALERHEAEGTTSDPGYQAASPDEAAFLPDKYRAAGSRQPVPQDEWHALPHALGRRRLRLHGCAEGLRRESAARADPGAVPVPVRRVR